MGYSHWSPELSKLFPALTTAILQPYLYQHQPSFPLLLKAVRKQAFVGFLHKEIGSQTTKIYPRDTRIFRDVHEGIHTLCSCSSFRGCSLPPARLSPDSSRYPGRSIQPRRLGCLPRVSRMRQPYSAMSFRIALASWTPHKSVLQMLCPRVFSEKWPLPDW